MPGRTKQGQMEGSLLQHLHEGTDGRISMVEHDAFEQSYYSPDKRNRKASFMNWQWDRSEKEFVGLVQWSLVFRDFCNEQPAGWTQVIFDHEQMGRIAAQKGYTLAAVASEMKRCGEKIDASIDSLRITREFEKLVEEEINTRIKEACSDRLDFPVIKSTVEE